MKWRTEVEIPEGEPKIGYGNFVLTLGSCFADHLSQKLNYYQIPQLGNPFGVLYHPRPIGHLVQRALEDRLFTQEDLFKHQDLWRCLQVHSELAKPSEQQALDCLNNALRNFQQAVNNASHLILTLGTGFAFRHLEKDEIVANCQKLPTAIFKRELSSVVELKKDLNKTVSLLKAHHKDLVVVVSVSPVRHARDGLVENQRSKAHLLAAAHALVDEGMAQYFPAYEILMDELRDYRFYQGDLLHPSYEAVGYVWDRFSQAWMDARSKPLMRRVEEVRKKLNHRPLHPGTPGNRKFRESLNEQIRALEEEYPFIRLSH